MANNSAIEWCDTTWNPLAGCTWASSGCDRCYAAVMARRLEVMALADIEAGRDPGGKRKYIGIANKNRAGRIMFNGVVNLDRAALSEPFGWKKPARVFVNSMSDLFHKDVPFDFVDQVFDTMIRTPRHTYQVLTKRPERMAEYATARALRLSGVLPANIWCGTSVENQAAADERIPWLLRVPARVRFLSCEPLLGPIDLTRLLVATPCWHCGNLDGEAGRCYCGVHIDPEIHWIIAGGESGPGARPCWPEWATSLRDQCCAAGVAYFFKQWGEYESYEEDAQQPYWRDQHGKLHDAHWLEVLNPESGEINPGWHEDSIMSPYLFRRVGKHAAGRLLDGVEHSEFPR